MTRPIPTPRAGDPVELLFDKGTRSEAWWLGSVESVAWRDGDDPEADQCTAGDVAELTIFFPADRDTVTIADLSEQMADNTLRFPSRHSAAAPSSTGRATNPRRATGAR